MEDLIEKIKSRIEDKIDEAHDGYNPVIAQTFRRALDIIEEETKAYKNGWIPCSERLPEKYGEYLCCDTYGNFILGFPSESNTSDTGFIVETEYEYCYDIIAWMELPEKYQKGE